MRLLYLHNYRGFTNTLFPLEKVNFLVGENSTGKTSILELVNSLSSPQFWFRSRSFKQYKRSQLFSDLLSIGLNNTDNFYVGGNENNQLVIFEFRNSHGEAFCSGLIIIDDGLIVYGRTVDNQIRYGVIDGFDPNEEVETLVQTTMERMRANQFDFKIDVREFRNEGIAPADLMRLVINSIREQNLVKNKRFHFNGIRPKSSNMIAPIRAKALKTYDTPILDFSEDGTHVPYALDNLFSISNEDSEAALKRLNTFGKRSGLFHNVRIHHFGNEPDSPFRIEVELFDKVHRIDQLGYGVAQVLPIIIEVIMKPNSRLPIERSIFIQQPEIHLHPKAQATLGSFLFQVSRQKIQLLVETHSDFIIDRFRFELSRARQKKLPSSQVLFFKKDKIGNKIETIKIDASGSYVNPSTTFRDFFIKEEVRMLSV